MPNIRLDSFSGISPRTGPADLAPNQAQVAKNTKLQSGDIRPWRKPLLNYAPATADVRTIYRMLNPATAATAWLEWGTDVNVVTGPVADTTEIRVYYTGDSTPRKTNWNLATTSGSGVKPFPNAYLQMGVPAPAAAPTLSATGGTAPTETRAYVYTYVSTFGAVLEESGPSPAATVTCNSSGATVTVSAFSTAPTTAAGYNITAIRIYRSITGTSSVSYQLVGQVSVTPSTGAASGSYSDTTTAANLGVVLPSLYYLPPPSDLKGLVAMPNGVLAGFTGNQVWFCEPYLPHAWPSSYMLTVGAPIVGLGVFGQSLVVCTTSNPYLISGSTPGSMTQEKLPLNEPCVSKKSIVGDQYGVLYASPNGVVSIAPGSMDVISRPLMTRDEWQTYAPTSIVGAIYQNMYLAFYETAGAKSCLVFMRGDSPPLITLENDAKAVYVDSTTANVFVAQSDNKIYQLDGDTVNNMFYEWMSKKFIMPAPTNFAALKAQADWAYIADASSYNAALALVIAANQAIWAAGTALKSTLNSTPLNTMSLNGSAMLPQPAKADVRNVQIIVLADEAQIFSAAITSGEPVRMPAASKAYIFEVRVTGNSAVRMVNLATSIGELRVS
jgi:hypothetical protein